MGLNKASEAKRGQFSRQGIQYGGDLQHSDQDFDSGDEKTWQTESGGAANEEGERESRASAASDLTVGTEYLLL